MATQTRYAGFWMRLLADIIDTVILTVAAWFLELLLLGMVYLVGNHSRSFTDAFNPFFLQVFNGVLYVMIAIPYYVWGHYRHGTTLGKWPLKIYVVSDANHLPISLKQSWIRCLSYAVSYLPFCAGFLMAAFQPEKKALHDLFAKTVSIIKPRAL